MHGADLPFGKCHRCDVAYGGCPTCFSPSKGHVRVIFVFIIQWSQAFGAMWCMMLGALQHPAMPDVRIVAMC
jgi:hypothetical protein